MAEEFEEKVFMDENGNMCFSGFVTLSNIEKCLPCYDGDRPYTHLQVCGLDMDNLFDKFIEHQLKKYSAEELTKIFGKKIEVLKNYMPS